MYVGVHVCIYVYMYVIKRLEVHIDITGTHEIATPGKRRAWSGPNVTPSHTNSSRRLSAFSREHAERLQNSNHSRNFSSAEAKQKKRDWKYSLE